MRFITLVKMDESMPFGPPPPALFEAVDQLSEEAAADGSLLDRGGLMPSFAGALLQLRNGTITVVDGPFSEAKEVIGGYAIYEARDMAEMIERAHRFLDLQVQHWPGFEGTVEVRPLMDDVGPADFGMQ